MKLSLTIMATLGGFPLLSAPRLTFLLCSPPPPSPLLPKTWFRVSVLGWRTSWGDCSFLIPPLHIAVKWITMRHQPNQKLALAIMLCRAYYKYDILTWVEVGGSDRNFREGIYSLCSSLCWNTLRRVNKQTTCRQCSVNACVGSTEM